MQTQQSEAKETMVRDLFAAFSRRDISEILAYFSDTAVYHKIPMARFDGHKQIAGTLQEFFVEGLTVEFQLQNIMVDDRKVMTERVTRVSRDGVVRDIPIMGIFEFDNSTRISAWRDYFDRGQAGIA